MGGHWGPLPQGPGPCSLNARAAAAEAHCGGNDRRKKKESWSAYHILGTSRRRRKARTRRGQGRCLVEQPLEALERLEHDVCWCVLGGFRGRPGPNNKKGVWVELNKTPTYNFKRTHFMHVGMKLALKLAVMGLKAARIPGAPKSPACCRPNPKDQGLLSKNLRGID